MAAHEFFAINILGDWFTVVTSYFAEKKIFREKENSLKPRKILTLKIFNHTVFLEHVDSLN